MKDKDMVNDVLSMVKSSLLNYERVISETSNPQLRQTIQQIRNSDEDFQYRLYQAADPKRVLHPRPTRQHAGYPADTLSNHGLANRKQIHP